MPIGVLKYAGTLACEDGELVEDDCDAVDEVQKAGRKAIDGGRVDALLHEGLAWRLVCAVKPVEVLLDDVAVDDDNGHSSPLDDDTDPLLALLPLPTTEAYDCCWSSCSARLLLLNDLDAALSTTLVGPAALLAAALDDAMLGRCFNDRAVLASNVSGTLCLLMAIDALNGVEQTGLSRCEIIE